MINRSYGKWRWLCLFFSSSGFTGFLPGAIIGKRGAGGGLAGSFVALLIQCIWISQMSSPLVVWSLIIGSFLIGWIIVEPAEALMLLKWGPRKRHTGVVTDHDFNQTNIDEVHGQFVAGLPLLFLANASHVWYVLLIAFVFFRLFDVIKPWPIKQVEAWRIPLPGGGALAIMLDDTLAGLLAAMVATIAMYLLAWLV